MGNASELKSDGQVGGSVRQLHGRSCARADVAFAELDRVWIVRFTMLSWNG